MYYRPEQVLEQYELEVKSVSRGRESYICETDSGQKILKEYKGSVQRAEFLADMLRHLNEEGLNVETVVWTKDNGPVAQAEDETKYMLWATFSGAECDTKNREDMLLAAEFLAKFHNLADSWQGMVPEFVRTEEDALLKLYEKHNRELKKVKNYIRTKKKKNQFEVMFAGQYASFMENALEVTKLLAEETAAPDCCGFCHGDYNQHNVLFTKKGMAMVHFDSFSWQMYVSDLTNFMRKMLEKNNWDTELGMELIQSYDKVRKLTEKERRYLYLSMAYPEKFWKIANHYYNTHKAWLSGRNIEKLEKLILQEKERGEFLSILYKFTYGNLHEA